MALLTLTRAAALAAVALLLPAASAARAEQVAEHDVKAAYLFNFTKFVTWPADAQRNAEPFRMCVVGDETATQAIERMMAGESVAGRPLRTVVPKSSDEAKSCQILFVSRTARERAAPLLAAVRHLPVLTVSDADGFLVRGGAIQFVRDGERVRFDISPVNARGGLSISSRLLRVARHVKDQSQ